MLALCAASPALAAGKRVVSLGSGRGYDNGAHFQAVLTGNSMKTVREALQADGFVIVSTESFVATQLSNQDIAFLGLFDPSQSLTSAERVALNTFVRNGGALIYMGDNSFFAAPNAGAGSLFGLAYSPDPTATFANVIPDTLHPVVRGPAGIVRVYDGSLNLPGFFGGISDLGSIAHAVLGTASRTVVAVIEPGALQTGSGPVVFISEANGFADAPTGTVGLGDNLTLIRNIFAFAAGESLGCLEDDDCNDGLYCTGVETCSGGQCQRGSFPCSSGDGCHEDSDSCGPCEEDGQCADGLFCNGDESCINGVCRPGDRPCVASDGCHEADDTCGPCESNEQCRDPLFCNGDETCGTDGVCRSGAEPCPEACERCDELAQSCAACLLDLDADGFIGTGDFAVFAGCFGECYSLGHHCLGVNFDGSADGCVGTGDFAAFSGCFGGSCIDCGNCDGPNSENNPLQTASGSVAGATVELVAVRQPSKLDTAASLPASEAQFNLNEVFFVEVWAARNKPADEGLAAVYVDLLYNPLLVRVLETIPSDSFSLFARGTNKASAGMVETLGGCAMLSDKEAGLSPAWVRVASVRMVSTQNGAAPLSTTTASDTYGIAVIGAFGNLSPASVSQGELNLMLGSGSLVIQAPALSNHSRRPR